MVNVCELFKRTRYRRTLLTILGLMIWGVGVAIMVTLFLKETIAGDDNYDDLVSAIESKDKVLGLSVDIQSFNPDHKEVDIKIGLIELRGFISSLKVIEDFDLIVGSDIKQFKVNQTTAPFMGKVRLEEGALRMFPFDKYKGELSIIAYTPATKEKEEQMIATMVSMEGNSQLFDITMDKQAMYSEGGFINSPIKIARPKTTVIISVFMTLIMWALSIAVMNLAIDYVIYSRETPPNFLLIGVSVMFSLPTLRKSQPGIPEMGCLIDLLGFFWSLSIVATSTCAILFHYVFSWKPSHFKKSDNS